MDKDKMIVDFLEREQFNKIKKVFNDPADDIHNAYARGMLDEACYIYDSLTKILLNDG